MDVTVKAADITALEGTVPPLLNKQLYCNVTLCVLLVCFKSERITCIMD